MNMLPIRPRFDPAPGLALGRAFVLALSLALAAFPVLPGSAFAAAGANKVIRLNVIALTGNDASRRFPQLEAIARAGNGSYHTVQDVRSLGQVFHQVVHVDTWAVTPAHVEQLLLDFRNRYLGSIDLDGEAVTFPRRMHGHFPWSALWLDFGGQAVAFLEGVDDIRLRLIVSEQTAPSPLDAEVDDFLARAGLARYARTSDLPVHLKGSSPPLGADRYKPRKPDPVASLTVGALFPSLGTTEEDVLAAIKRQAEMESLFAEVVPSAYFILDAIARLPEKSRNQEFRSVLGTMLERRAEVAAYRQMALDNGLLDPADDFSRAISEIVIGRDHSARAMDIRLELRMFIDGHVERERLEQAVLKSVRMAGSNLSGMELGSLLRPKFREVVEKRDEINRYGGGASGNRQPLRSYRELLEEVRRSS